MFAMVVFDGGAALADGTYSFTTINIPGGSGTEAYGINNSGRRSWGIITTLPCRNMAFWIRVATLALSMCLGLTVLSAPKPTGSTTAAEIVGTFFGGQHGFVDVGGNFSTINVPGARGTAVPFGINNKGQIVGYIGHGTVKWLRVCRGQFRLHHCARSLRNFCLQN